MPHAVPGTSEAGLVSLSGFAPADPKDVAPPAAVEAGSSAEAEPQVGSGAAAAAAAGWPVGWPGERV